MFKLKLYIKTQTFGDVLSESDLKAVQAGLFALVLIRALALPRVITDRKVAVNFGAVSISMTEAFAPRRVMIVSMKLNNYVCVCLVDGERKRDLFPSSKPALSQPPSTTLVATFQIAYSFRCF